MTSTNRKHTATAHTPTPKQLNLDFLYIQRHCAHAQYIVTAVNERDALVASHKALVAACEKTLPALEWALTHQPGNMNQFLEVGTLIKDALARAKEVQDA